MSNGSSQLKARIRNLSQEINIPAQVILQKYMFERLLLKITKSKYKNNFILKGGLLIGALVGIENRTTMDMDITLKQFPLNQDKLSIMINEICNRKTDDIIFDFLGLDKTRQTDDYLGYRVHMIATYGKIRTPLKIDVTTGDVITPSAINYEYQLFFSDESIDLLSYNIETILAEKLETILRRMELNTRIRDFYDVYILTKIKDVSNEIFIQALNNTVKHRKTEHILVDINKRFVLLKKNDELQKRWIQYTNEYTYAKDITYNEMIKSIRALIDVIS